MCSDTEKSSPPGRRQPERCPALNAILDVVSTRSPTSKALEAGCESTDHTAGTSPEPGRDQEKTNRESKCLPTEGQKAQNSYNHQDRDTQVTQLLRLASSLLRYHEARRCRQLPFTTNNEWGKPHCIKCLEARERVQLMRQDALTAAGSRERSSHSPPRLTPSDDAKTVLFAQQITVSSEIPGQLLGICTRATASAPAVLPSQPPESNDVPQEKSQEGYHPPHPPAADTSVATSMNYRWSDGYSYCTETGKRSVVSSKLSEKDPASHLAGAQMRQHPWWPSPANNEEDTSKTLAVLSRGSSPAKGSEDGADRWKQQGAVKVDDATGKRMRRPLQESPATQQLRHWLRQQDGDASPRQTVNPSEASQSMMHQVCGDDIRALVDHTDADPLASLSGDRAPEGIEAFENPEVRAVRKQPPIQESQQQGRPTRHQRDAHACGPLLQQDSFGPGSEEASVIPETGGFTQEEKGTCSYEPVQCQAEQLVSNGADASATDVQRADTRSRAPITHLALGEDHGDRTGKAALRKKRLDTGRPAGAQLEVGDGRRSRADQRAQAECLLQPGEQRGPTRVQTAVPQVSETLRERGQSKAAVSGPSWSAVPPDQTELFPNHAFTPWENERKILECRVGGGPAPDVAPARQGNHASRPIAKSTTPPEPESMSRLPCASSQAWQRHGETVLSSARCPPALPVLRAAAQRLRHAFREIAQIPRQFGVCGGDPGCRATLRGRFLSTVQPALQKRAPRSVEKSASAERSVDMSLRSRLPILRQHAFSPAPRDTSFYGQYPSGVWKRPPGNVARSCGKKATLPGGPSNAPASGGRSPRASLCFPGDRTLSGNIQAGGGDKLVEGTRPADHYSLSQERNKLAFQAAAALQETRGQHHEPELLRRLKLQEWLGQNFPSLHQAARPSRQGQTSPGQNFPCRAPTQVTSEIDAARADRLQACPERTADCSRNETRRESEDVAFQLADLGSFFVQNRDRYARASRGEANAVQYQGLSTPRPHSTSLGFRSSFSPVPRHDRVSGAHERSLVAPAVTVCGPDETSRAASDRAHGYLSPSSRRADPSGIKGGTGNPWVCVGPGFLDTAAHAVLHCDRDLEQARRRGMGPCGRDGWLLHWDRSHPRASGKSAWLPRKPGRASNDAKGRVGCQDLTDEEMWNRRTQDGDSNRSPRRVEADSAVPRGGGRDCQHLAHIEAPHAVLDSLTQAAAAGAAAAVAASGRVFLQGAADVATDLQSRTAAPVYLRLSSLPESLHLPRQSVIESRSGKQTSIEQKRRGASASLASRRLLSRTPCWRPAGTSLRCRQSLPLSLRPSTLALRSVNTPRSSCLPRCAPATSSGSAFQSGLRSQWASPPGYACRPVRGAPTSSNARLSTSRRGYQRSSDLTGQNKCLLSFEDAGGGETRSCVPWAGWPADFRGDVGTCVRLRHPGGKTDEPQAVFFLKKAWLVPARLRTGRRSREKTETPSSRSDSSDSGGDRGRRSRKRSADKARRPCRRERYEPPERHARRSSEVGRPTRSRRRRRKKGKKDRRRHDDQSTASSDDASVSERSLRLSRSVRTDGEYYVRLV